MAMIEGWTTLPYGEALRLATSALCKAGMESEAASLVSEWFLDSDLGGVPSHGLRLLPQLIERIGVGATNPRPEPRIVGGRGAVLTIDGDNGPGPLVAAWAMDRGLEAAEVNGCAVVGVRNTHHLGALAYLVRRATSRRMVAFVTQNTRINMAPYGGSRKALGNNPVGWGVPIDDDRAVVLDMALSRRANGTIKIAKDHGMPLEDGIALDEDGQPTIDPERALRGALVAFGEHKGSAIALIAGALSGVLTGANYGGHVPHPDDHTRPRSLGVHLALIDVTAMLPWEDYVPRMRDYVDFVRTEGTNDGEFLRLPGERHALNRRDALRDGVTVDTSVLLMLS